MNTATRAKQPEPVAQPFRYDTPDASDPSKASKYVVRLARTDRIMANVQVLRNGGENNLHTHHHMDGMWMVLKGRVRFYTENDAIVGEYGPYEGVLIPRHFKYWFESIGDEVLEILQVEAADFPMPMDRPAEREDFTPMTNTTKNLVMIDARINEPTYGQNQRVEWEKK